MVAHCSSPVCERRRDRVIGSYRLFVVRFNGHFRRTPLKLWLTDQSARQAQRLIEIRWQIVVILRADEVSRIRCATRALISSVLRVRAKRPSEVDAAVGLIGRDDLLGRLMAGNPKIKRAEDVVIRVRRITLVGYPIKYIGPGTAGAVIHPRDQEEAEESLRLGDCQRGRVRQSVRRLGRCNTLISN